jgi:glutamate/tyrosine decarboxylase-like PLP-dependent enzyme
VSQELLLKEDEIREAARLLGEAIADYQATLPERPVFPSLDRGLIRRILDEPLPEKGRPWPELFREFRDEIVPNSTQIGHPRYIAYVLASPHGLSAFSDALIATLNQGCSIWELSPVASAVEQKVLAWFRWLFGLPADGAGYLTSGGSMANLSALAVARDRRLGAAARAEGLQGGRAPLVLYTSEEVHTSVDKAAALLGLGVDSVRRIPVDGAFRIRIDSLERAIARDRESGLVPFCVVASAGTVTTGAIDPIATVAEICRREDLWLHVDGAYGAFFVLSERLAPALRDAGLADSLALDPHKLLFNSLEAGCVLYRDGAHPQRSFGFASSYISKEPDPDLLDFSEYGPELSRSFKALKIWWALRSFGRRAYADTIDRLLDLAQHMAERIEAHHGLELAAPVTLTAVCFRARGLDDAGQARLLRRLVDSGLAHLGPARVKGRFCLRACMTNLRTTAADLDAVVAEVGRLAARPSE